VGCFSFNVYSVTFQQITFYFFKDLPLLCTRVLPQMRFYAPTDVMSIAVRLTVMMEQLRYYSGSGVTVRSSYLSNWLVSIAAFAFSQRTCKFVFS